ncbi:MAG TPA: recombinase family protein [Pirellulales bacterium]
MISSIAKLSKRFLIGGQAQLAGVFTLLLGILAAKALLATPACSSGDVMLALTVSAIGLASRARRRQPAAAAASYSRFSSQLQDEASIETQQQKCREAAARDGNAIGQHLEFADRAVSGTKLDRDGLNALMAAAEAGEFNTLYFFSLSRLARESVISMPILKRLVHVQRIRVISVSEGVDSAREGWEMVAQILSMQHERYVKELSANVLRGQEANVKNKLSVGDYCFGYTTVPVPGSEQTRRGRHARPRMTYVIEPEEARWVQQIFTWFVEERRSLRWIVRELNRQGAPKDHRSTTTSWHHQYIPRLLSNSKYVGRWSWGLLQNVRDPSTGTVSQDVRPAEQSDQWERHFPELRIVDDETFGAAQRLLTENAARRAHRHRDDGTFSRQQRGGAVDSPSHLLSGLIVCGECGRTFHVGGAHGKYLFCPGYHQGVCRCQTTLNRQLAESLVLAEISARIFDNPLWLDSVVRLSLDAWERRQRWLPDELRSTENRLEEVTRKIGRLIDTLENQKIPDSDVQDRIAERRAERRELMQRLTILRASADELPTAPTRSWILEQLHRIHEVLANRTPAAAFALRELVGGRITVEEVRRDKAKRYFLTGTFDPNLSRAMTLLAIPGSGDGDGKEGTSAVTIEFVRPDSLAADADQAKRLVDAGLSNKEIAKKLGCSQANITKLLKHWSQINGIELGSGHSRRAQRRRDELEPALYRDIADRVKQLVDGGCQRQQIAAILNCDMATITKAVRYWYESRHLLVPDGRVHRPDLSAGASRSDVDRNPIDRYAG